MICDKCKNKCDICGQPIYPGYIPNGIIYPPYYVGDIPNGVQPMCNSSGAGLCGATNEALASGKTATELN